jgi:hypothetical protein
MPSKQPPPPKKTEAPALPQQRKPPEVEIFFDSRDGSYWYQINGRYVSLKRSDLYMHLRLKGLRDDLYYDGLRELDWPLYAAQNNRMIDYAGSLAGHRTGIFADGSGRKYLVTDEPKGVWDKLDKHGKEPAFFASFIQELLDGDQWLFFCHWLSIALQSLRRADFCPGQAVILAGPAKCGKSLLQCIITEILGGRGSDPTNYLFGLTQFNRDLITSEHWLIQDPRTTTDIRSRREFGEMLKQSTVNRDFTVHMKGKDALTLPIFRRVTISVNNEPENLAVCPPLEPAISDKLFLFRCGMVERAFDPFRKADGEFQREACWQAIKDEIPQIRAWLVKRFRKVPKALQEDRFGIVAWHHDELRAELSSLSPETRLLQLVDQVLFSGRKDGPHTKWEGQSMDLEKVLRGGEFAFETEKILRFIGACGSYLGKLSKSAPHRVSKRVVGGYAHWTIQPPPDQPKE